jgi:hypothetical protein
MFLKNLLKRYFLILKVRNRFSAAVQISQRRLYLYYKDKIGTGGIVPMPDTGFRVFSQFEEDGMLLYIFSVLGMGSRTFVEIGSDDGVNSNCANLAFNFGWSGLFIDASKESINRGKRFYARYPHPWMYSPKFHWGEATPDNINGILTENQVTGEIELLSIDIDGDDYWVWDAIEVIQPKVVIIETFIRFGMHDIVVPYGERYGQEHGASPAAMVKLARKKGYRLVGANQLGFNFIFIKEPLAREILTEVIVESILHHPSAVKSMNEFVLKETKKYVAPIP